jgi:hypothetical protein
MKAGLSESTVFVIPETPAVPSRLWGLVDESSGFRGRFEVFSVFDDHSR